MEKRNQLNKLRLFIYGKNALNDFQNLFSMENKNIGELEENNVKYNYIKDKEISWDYLVFSGEITEQINEAIKSLLDKHFSSENVVEINKQIKKISDKYKNSPNNDLLNKELKDLINEKRCFYDVLILPVENLLDEDSQTTFNFFQKLSREIARQPFIIYLTKKDNNPDVKNLYKFITNDIFDKRNLFAIKFPVDVGEKENLQKILIDAMNYYHEIGTGTTGAQSQTFNILICGVAGAGKSTFINQFLQQKCAKEGDGLSMTHEITSYIHPKYPIRIYDTPGIEGENTALIVKKTIIQLEKDNQDAKNHLDLILYFSKLENRTFNELEYPIIRYLIRRRSKIIFVTNNFGKAKREIKKLLNVMKNSLKQIIMTSTSDPKEKVELEPEKIDEKKMDDIINNCSVICLKQKIEGGEEDDEDEKIKIKQGYGMDELFERIHNLFKNEKISTDEIEDADSVEDLIQIIRKNKLLSYMETIQDIKVNLQIELSKIVLSYAKFDKFIWFFQDKRRKDLLEIISEKNSGNKINRDKVFHDIVTKLEKINKKEVRDNFFNSIKSFEKSFNTEGFQFDIWFYNEYTLLFGAVYLKEFEKEYGQYDAKTKNFLKKLSDSFNTAIKSFAELSTEWKGVYADLKNHKTNKEWVHKSFFVEIPKKLESF